MSFWESKTGAPITGDAEVSFAGFFKIIPDGTTARAAIKLFESGPIFYQITWKITDGEFKNREVRQKINVFEMNPDKAQRALNMLMRIYKICGHKPTHSEAPTDADLLPMVGFVCGIKIQEWSMLRPDGTMAEGNWVAEVHPADAEFIVETGIKQVSRPGDSALTRHSRGNEVKLVDDLPF